jgi:hypothetical protein
MTQRPIETERPDDTVDPELMALAEEGNDSVLKPLLMIAVIALGFWIVDDWREELEYFFSPSEPAEIGEVTDFASEVMRDPNYEPPIPHNRFVKLSGIPSQRSMSERYMFFKLIGGEGYVEAEREDADMDPLERELEGEPKGDIDRVYFQGQGRALSFAKMPGRYNGVRRYYQTRYGTVFCEQLDEQDREDLLQRKRDAIIEQWLEEYESLVDEAGSADAVDMKPKPSDEDIARIMSLDPVCVKAFLIQKDVEPGDHVWYLVLTAFFGGFMLFNLVMLVRWVRRFFGR